MSRKNTQKKQNKIQSVGVRNIAPTPNIFTPICGSRDCGNNIFWRWGNDNLFPYALASMSRCSVPHRRIINDKADYISGKGFAVDESQSKLSEFIENVNGSGESLRQVLNKLAFDKSLFGNAFLEITTDSTHSFLSLFHQDASKCRVAHDKEHILIHHNWATFTQVDAKSLPIYPLFEQQDDGTRRSVIHYKDYEPMFEHYGVPQYIAGMNVSAIAHKTDKWNISRLNNSYQLSGVMILTGSTDTEEQAKEIVQQAEAKFAGEPGQVMFMLKESSDETDGSKFIPITSQNDGDWKLLHDQATSDIVVAHSWFRSLSGLDYSTGFNAERVLYEYQIALNTVIIPEQTELMEPICNIIENIAGFDTTSLQIINKPPLTQRPSYMKIWEARKADGLDYDPEDESQQLYLSQINTNKNETAN